MGQGKDVVDKLLCNACCVDIIDETAKIYLVIRAFVVCDLAQKGVVCNIKNCKRNNFVIEFHSCHIIACHFCCQNDLDLH